MVMACEPITPGRTGPAAEGIQSRQREVDLARLESRASVFVELGRSLSTARTPREAAHSIISAADSLFGWDACFFALVGADKQRLTTVVAIDTIEGERKEVPSSDDEPGPVTGEALRRGPQLILRGQDYAMPPAGQLPFGDLSRASRSLMTVPVTSDSKTLAVISIQSYQPGAYTQEDLNMLAALAEHCAGALERVRAEEEVSRLHSEIRTHLEELQTLFDVAPVGIAVAHDRDCLSVSINAACARIFGLESARELSDFGLCPDSLPLKLLQNGNEIPTEDWPLRRAAQGRPSTSGQDYEIVVPGGRKFYCHVRASPLFADNGEVRGSLGIFVDLTERKKAEGEILRLNSELEKRVRERTMQLEAANKELEAFSYSVSHDLRAPLRSIRGFSEVLLERYGGQLDTRGQEFLKRTCDSCAHMDRLIDDLLKLSRVNRSELQYADVDLSAVAESLFAEIRKTEANRDVEFRVAPGLVARGDERLLRLALDNLLRNAWKFTRDQPRPVIEFGQIGEPDYPFFVRDNGAGFDMAYAARLFGVFQRLHTASEFPGTGVGLATVQRIINRHGGRTWGEGVVDQGAAFFFTLPSDVES